MTKVIKVFMTTLFFTALFISCGGGTKVKQASAQPDVKVEPMTRTTVQQALSAKSSDKLAVGTYQGCELIPDANPMTGFKFTGNTCSVTVKEGNLVSVSFVSQKDIPVALYSITVNFVGEFSEGQVLIVQYQGDGRKVVSATHTIYDPKGVVVYGLNGGKGDYIKECTVMEDSAIRQRHCGG